MADRNKLLQSGTRRRHWRLLLVGDHGETITINRIKGLMIALAVVAATMLVAAAFFFYVNRQLVAANAMLKSALEQMTSKQISLRNDRDLYMARLVATESRLGGLGEAVDEKTVPAQPAGTGETDRGLEETKTDGQIHDEIAVTTDSSGLSKETAVAAGQSGIEVENTILAYDAANQTLEMRYRIRITDPMKAHITGRTIAILKPGVAEQAKWLTLPKTALDPAGRPVHWEKGRLFSISNFRDIVLEVKPPPLATEFTIVTIWVFSETGDLLVKRDVPLTADQG